jgi:hypothetical protein
MFESSCAIAPICYVGVIYMTSCARLHGFVVQLWALRSLDLFLFYGQKGVHLIYMEGGVPRPVGLLWVSAFQPCSLVSLGSYSWSYCTFRVPQIIILQLQKGQRIGKISYMMEGPWNCFIQLVVYTISKMVIGGVLIILLNWDGSNWV